MIRCDALVVGGGPAGSTCARTLGLSGWDVLVADRARFPRDKVCAGWLTPAVFPLLDLDPEEYRATGLTFQEITAFRTGVIGGGLIETRYPSVVSYAIRRCEFDEFLLGRANARRLEGTSVHDMERRGDRWIVDGAIETPVVIGAGGHFCPVARFLRGGVTREARQPVVAKEAEYPMTDEELARADQAAPELFFCRDLEGYAWRVRKGRFINVGIGRRDPRRLTSHLDEFLDRLEPDDLARRARLRAATWKGHAYLAAGIGPRPLVGEGIMVIGDAAGLAYPESGEGICPAIESGRLAAETLVAAAGRHDAAALAPYTEAIAIRHPPAPMRSHWLGWAMATAGRALLRSPSFTRRIVLDRWFLRSAPTRP